MTEKDQDKIKTLSAGGIVTRRQQAAFVEMEQAIIKAIQTAIVEEVPQGFIVAVLAGHFHAQTQRMISDA